MLASTMSQVWTRKVWNSEIFKECCKWYITSTKPEWACSQRNESRSESRFRSLSASWLGSWFQLCAFTSIANAFPITNRICTLRGNILFLLRSPRWLTHVWLQFTKGKIRLSNQESVRITFRNGFRNVIRSFVNRPNIHCFEHSIMYFVITSSLLWGILLAASQILQICYLGKIWNWQVE